MKSLTRRNVRLSGAALLMGALCLFGCAPQTSTVVPGYIQVENVKDTEQTIMVRASETVKVVPDMAVIVYGVNSEDKDAAACQQKNSEAVAKVADYLKGQGLAETSIATSGFSLDPMYDWSGSERVLTGYEMRTQITVSDVPLEQAGALISQAVAAGANEILSVDYLSSKYDEAYAEALASAVKQAKSKAEAMAHAEDCQVVGVVSMEEYGDQQQGRYVNSGFSRKASMASGAAEAAVMDMAVMAGEMEVEADIQVVYQLLPR